MPQCEAQQSEGCLAAGHAYYFLEDVYPRMAHGRRPLKTPGFIKALFPAERIQSSPGPTAAAAPAPAAQFPAPGVVPPPVGMHNTTLKLVLTGHVPALDWLCKAPRYGLWVFVASVYSS